MSSRRRYDAFRNLVLGELTIRLTLTASISAWRVAGQEAEQIGYLGLRIEPPDVRIARLEHRHLLVTGRARSFASVVMIVHESEFHRSSPLRVPQSRESEQPAALEADVVRPLPVPQFLPLLISWSVGIRQRWCRDGSANIGFLAIPSAWALIGSGTFSTSVAQWGIQPPAKHLQPASGTIPLAARSPRSADSVRCCIAT